MRPSSSAAQKRPIRLSGIRLLRFQRGCPLMKAPRRGPTGQHSHFSSPDWGYCPICSIRSRWLQLTARDRLSPVRRPAVGHCVPARPPATPVDGGRIAHHADRPVSIRPISKETHYAYCSIWTSDRRRRPRSCACCMPDHRAWRQEHDVQSVHDHRGQHR